MRFIKLFEAEEPSKIEDIVNCYQDLIDDMNLEIIPGQESHYMFHNGRHITELKVEKSYLYAPGYLITIRERGVGVESNLYNRWKDLENYKHFETLLQAHERTETTINNINSIVSSIEKWSERVINILYFMEAPKFPKGIEVYGETVTKDMDKIKGKIMSNLKTHPNLIDVYINKHFGGMYSLCGYYSPIWRYNVPPIRVNNPNQMDSLSKVDKWVFYEWGRMCKKLKIGTSSKVTDVLGTTIVFMNWLSDNQSSFEKFVSDPPSKQSPC